MCASTNCGDSCNLNAGPLTATMAVDGTEDCGSIPTITTDTLPSATEGIWSSLSNGPLPPSLPASAGAAAPSAGAAAPSAALAKRDNLFVDERAVNESASYGLIKRMLPSPADPAAYITSLNPTWISQMGLTAGTWFDFTANGRQAAGVNGIYGCTAVFVVSQRGVYISHTWENPVFINNEWEPADPAVFKTQSSDIMINGNANSPSLSSMIGTDDDPGPLNAKYQPQVFVVTPYDDYYGQKVMGVTGVYRYQDQAAGIGGYVAQAVTGNQASYRLIPYTRTDKEKSTAAGYVGRAIIEYDPYEQMIARPKRGSTPARTIQISKWRLWVEETPTEEQTYYRDNGVVVGNQKRQASSGACPVPTASGSLSASASSGAASTSSVPMSSMSSISANSSVPASSSVMPISTSSGSITAPPSSTSSAAVNSISSSVPPPYCVPYQDPDLGINGYCQCTDGADFSFASSGNNSCPYTSPGPASLSINPATVTGTVSQASNPVPPITIVPASSTSSAPASPSSSLAAQCGSVAKAPVCQTSDGSPLITDCQAFFFQGDEALCSQAYGSGCANVQTSGTCELTLCQPDDVFGDSECLSGDNECLTYWIDQLIDTCGSNGNVGGYITIPASDGSDGYLNLEFTYHK